MHRVTSDRHRIIDVGGGGHEEGSNGSVAGVHLDERSAPIRGNWTRTQRSCWFRVVRIEQILLESLFDQQLSQQNEKAAKFLEHVSESCLQHLATTSFPKASEGILSSPNVFVHAEGHWMLLNFSLQLSYWMLLSPDLLPCLCDLI